MSGVLVPLGGRQLPQPVDHVDDGHLGLCRQPAADQHQRRGLATALLDDGGRGRRVAGDAGRARVRLQQLHGGGRVQPAQCAGPHVGHAGQRAAGHGDDQALGLVRQQRVDLFGADGVVQEQQRPAPVQRAAQRLGQFVLARPGGHGRAQRGEQGARGAFGGYGLAVGAGEPGAQYSVRVLRGQLPGEFLGERGAAGAGASGDEQYPAARLLAAGEGVEAGAHDVGAQFLEFALPPDECAGRRGGSPTGRPLLTGSHFRSGGRPPGGRRRHRFSGLHRPFRHGPLPSPAYGGEVTACCTGPPRPRAGTQRA
ncbi:hypothetical protein GCM10020000_63270 [Streptomyces olivoverticillatus]